MSKLELTKELAISITACLPIGVCLAAQSGEIVYANSKAEDIFGYSKEELTDCVIEDLLPENYRHTHKNLRDNYTASPTSIAMSGGRLLSGLKKDGTEVQLQIGLSPLNEQYILISLIETTNEIIKPSNSNDPLTGLANRKVFDDYSDKLRKLAIRNKKSISVAFIDLDNFKSVNDRLGHQVGDVVLCEVARLLRNYIRGSDIVARVGGDEFILCLYDIAGHLALKNTLDQLISKIAAITEIEGHSINIGASVGAIVTFTPEKIAISELIDMTDKLMYQAKKTGKGIAVVKEINT
jgi:diguanylate cyclase (GGDEF)-like protein/PAS domain S-box-containing protein